MKIFVQHPDLAPYKKYPTDAGWDLRAGETTVIYPGQTRVIPAGIKVEIPQGYVGIIKPRSSVFRKGIIIDGVIDPDYRGEVGIMCNNTADHKHVITRGERIAQLLVIPCLVQELEFVSELELSETDRGEGGFGSTGVE